MSNNKKRQSDTKGVESSKGVVFSDENFAKSRYLNRPQISPQDSKRIRDRICAKLNMPR